MAKREIGTCTQNGMTQSQPGTSVSCTTGAGINGAILHVSRHYPTLRNQWGGRGVSKPLDCDGMHFATCEAAHKFARERGYTREFFTPADLRARHVANGAERKAHALDFKKRLANGTLFARR